MNTQLYNQTILDNLVQDIWPTIYSTSQATISEATRQSYSKIYENIASKIDYGNGIALSDILSQSARKNTYYLRLAACRYAISSKLLSEYEKARIAISANNSDTFHQCESVIHKLKCELTEINAMPPSSQIKAIKCRGSKRSSLSGLPSDWRKRLCYRMISSKYFLHSLLLAICGCRPHEMKTGVRIELVNLDQDEFLTVEIFGAKVTDKNGQRYRHLTFKSDHNDAFLSPLIHHAQEAGGSSILKIQNEKALTSAVCRFSTELWPRHKESISPYSFRHAFASDMKASGDQDNVALSLGHRSTRTQKTYGQKQLSKSTDHPRPIEVSAPFPVRQKITRFSKVKVPITASDLTKGC